MTKFENKRMGKCKQNENKIRYLILDVNNYQFRY